jgi:hypothetical protein|tara:strand:- start:18912 stop:19148 length:237 start_codon:yes stop_codon:yes gene_type:complete
MELMLKSLVKNFVGCRNDELDFLLNELELFNTDIDKLFGAFKELEGDEYENFTIDFEELLRGIYYQCAFKCHPDIQAI